MKYRILSEEDRATATCNMYKNVVKFGLFFEICERTDRQ